MSIPGTDIAITNPTAIASAIVASLTALAAFMKWYGGPNRYLWLVGALVFNFLVVVLWSALPQLGDAHRTRETILVAGAASLLVAGLWSLACPRLLDRLQATGAGILSKLHGPARQLPIGLGLIPIIVFAAAVIRQPDDRITVLIATAFKDEPAWQHQFRTELRQAANRHNFRIRFEDREIVDIGPDDALLKRNDAVIFGSVKYSSGDAEVRVNVRIASIPAESEPAPLQFELGKSRSADVSVHVRYLARLTEFTVAMVKYSKGDGSGGIDIVHRMDQQSAARDQELSIEGSSGIDLKLSVYVGLLTHIGYKAVCAEIFSSPDAISRNGHPSGIATGDKQIRYSPLPCQSRTDRELIRDILKVKLEDSETSPLLVAYGDILLELRDFESARKAFERALEVAPDFHMASKGLREAHLWSKNLCAALQANDDYNAWRHLYLPRIAQDKTDRERSEFLEYDRKRCQGVGN